MDDLETGESVTSANTYVVHEDDHPDGSITIAFTGITFAVQGGGRAYVDSGRDLIVWSTTAVTPLSGAGPSADLCEALTAAIE